MKTLALFLLLFVTPLSAQELLFKPPEGWSAAAAEALPPNVRFLFIGKGKGSYPPSINLGIEPYKGTLKQYLTMMERVNKGYGDKWTNLGMIETAAGKASLSQVELNNQWGAIKLMHLVLIRDRKVYVLTAATKREEFAAHSTAILDAFKSVNLTPSALDKADGNTKALYLALLAEHEKYLESHPGLTDAEAFESEPFQSQFWIPFRAGVTDASLVEHARLQLTAKYE